MNFILNYLNKTATLPEMTLYNSYLDSAIILTSVSTHSLIIIYVFFFSAQTSEGRGIFSVAHFAQGQSCNIWDILFINFLP